MKSKLKVSFIVAYGMVTSSMPVHAEGIPVIDPANLPQAVLTAYEEVAQTLKQIEQFENQVKNTLAPAFYVLDQYNETMKLGQEAMMWVSSLEDGLSTDGYLDKFKNIDYYRDSPCFKVPGCTQEEWNEIDRRDLASKSQMLSNNALFKNIVDQANSLLSDGAQLEGLKAHAKASVDSELGRMAALVNANEIAAFQADQSLKLRSAITSLNQVIATKAQYEADLNAKLELTSDLSNKPSATYMTGATSDDEPLSMHDLILDWDV